VPPQRSPEGHSPSVDEHTATAQTPHGDLLRRVGARHAARDAAPAHRGRSAGRGNRACWPRVRGTPSTRSPSRSSPRGKRCTDSPATERIPGPARRLCPSRGPGALGALGPRRPRRRPVRRPAGAPRARPRRDAGDPLRARTGCHPGGGPLARRPLSRLPGERRVRLPRPAPGHAGALLHDPQLARTRILDAARRQFPRRRRAALVAAAHRRRRAHHDLGRRRLARLRHRDYIRATGDAAILDENVPFIDGPAARARRARSFYAVPDGRTSPARSTSTAPRPRPGDFAHRPNGLPLILGGDWNDGMNRVGIGGQGESVWLGWFLLRTLADFLPHAEARGRRAEAAALARTRTHAEGGDRIQRLGRPAGTGARPTTTAPARLASLRRVHDRFHRRSRGACCPATAIRRGRARPSIRRSRPNWSTPSAPDRPPVHAALLDGQHDPGYIAPIRPAYARTAASTPMPPRGWSSRWHAGDAPTRPIAFRHAQPGACADARRPRRRATGWRPIAVEPPVVGGRRLFGRRQGPGAAAGPGTRDRPAGCSAPAWRASSASASIHKGPGRGRS
jgi:hypothetical protein